MINVLFCESSYFEEETKKKGRRLLGGLLYSIQERQVLYFSNHIFSVTCLLVSTVTKSVTFPTLTGWQEYAQWPHYIWLFFSWADDVMIFHPVVGGQMWLIPKHLLATLSKPHLTLRRPKSYESHVVNIFIAPLGESFLSKTTPLLVCPLYEMSPTELKRAAFCLSDSLQLRISLLMFLSIGVADLSHKNLSL